MIYGIERIGIIEVITDSTGVVGHLKNETYHIYLYTIIIKLIF